MGAGGEEGMKNSVNISPLQRLTTLLAVSTWHLRADLYIVHRALTCLHLSFLLQLLLFRSSHSPTHPQLAHTRQPQLAAIKPLI